MFSIHYMICLSFSLVHLPVKSFVTHLSLVVTILLFDNYYNRFSFMMLYCIAKLSLSFKMTR